MKLFSWAHRKLLPNTSLHKNQHNADHLFEISPPSLAPGCELGVKAAEVRRDTHTEVLTIGTLGMGSLLTRAEEEEEEEEEEEVEEEDVHIVHSPSPTRQSMSSNRASTSSNHALTSSNRASVSSNRESVSSVDIQKLQEELQKILYFKVGQEHKANATLDDKSKGKAKKKHKKDRQASGYYINDMNAKQMGNADGKAHMPSERGSMRGALPLHNFLEMPMDSMSSNATMAPHKLLGKAHYLLLMQSLKSKLLHYTSPTRVKLSPSLFEKLLEPKVKRDLQHGSTMDKMLHLLRKVMNKRPHGRWKNGQEGNTCEEDKPKCVHEEEEERLKWAVAKSCRGSDRFIHYITSTLAHSEKDKNSLVHDHQQLHHYQYQFHFQEGGSLQLKLATSPSLDNECWIKTDDEYLVLEL